MGLGDEKNYYSVSAVQQGKLGSLLEEAISVGFATQNNTPNGLLCCAKIEYFITATQTAKTIADCDLRLQKLEG